MHASAPAPAARSKPRAIMRMLTTKFIPRPVITAPPQLGPDAAQERRTAALRARGLLPAKDLSAQEREQDACIPVVGPAEPQGLSAADLIKREYEARSAADDAPSPPDALARMRAFRFGGSTPTLVLPPSNDAASAPPSPTHSPTTPAARALPVPPAPLSPPPTYALPPLPPSPSSIATPYSTSPSAASLPPSPADRVSPTTDALPSPPPSRALPLPPSPAVPAFVLSVPDAGARLRPAPSVRSLRSLKSTPDALVPPPAEPALVRDAPAGPIASPPSPTPGVTGATPTDAHGAAPESDDHEGQDKDGHRHHRDQEGKDGRALGHRQDESGALIPDSGHTPPRSPPSPHATRGDAGPHLPPAAAPAAPGDVALTRARAAGAACAPGARGPRRGGGREHDAYA